LILVNNFESIMKNTFSVALLATLYSCAPSTQITGSWESPDAGSKKYRSIIVTALTDNPGARETAEQNVASVLTEQGVKATKSIDILPPNFTQGKQVDKEVLMDKIHATGSTAILTIALINKETEQRYVPGTYGYTPITRFGYYGRFSGYYTQWYPTLYSPGYYEQDKIYFIETNVYDSRTEDLIWSAQSETYNPSTLSGFSRDFAEAVIGKLAKDGIIAGK
jgi:hypothetical protein